MKADVKVVPRAPSMPQEMVMGIEACINAALNGCIAQIELSAGNDIKSGRKVRLIVIPDHVGTIREIKGVMTRVINVTEELGEIKEVKRT